MKECCQIKLNCNLKDPMPDTDSLLLVTGLWLLDTGFWRLVIVYGLLHTDYWLPGGGC